MIILVADRTAYFTSSVSQPLPSSPILVYTCLSLAMTPLLALEQAPIRVSRQEDSDGECATGLTTVVWGRQWSKTGYHGIARPLQRKTVLLIFLAEQAPLETQGLVCTLDQTEIWKLLWIRCLPYDASILSYHDSPAIFQTSRIKYVT